MKTSKSKKHLVPPESSGMKDSTRKLLETFAQYANWRTVGLPDDMERFFDFVIGVYLAGDHNISQDEFLNVIKDSYIENDGQTKTILIRKLELSSKIFMFTKYEDGIKLLIKYNSNDKNTEV